VRRGHCWEAQAALGKEAGCGGWQLEEHLGQDPQAVVQPARVGVAAALRQVPLGHDTQLQRQRLACDQHSTVSQELTFDLRWC
jgi:hypothetical protein